MKIGFDAKRAMFNRSGLGNYSRDVIADMHSYHSENRYFLYTPKLDASNHFFQKFPNEWVLPRNAFWRRLSSLWRYFGIAKQLKKQNIDVYHGLSAEIPKGLKKQGIRSVVTIHDLIFLRYPHYFDFFARQIYNYKSKKACQNADRIIAISEQTKSDIINFYSIQAEKIEVIYQSCHKQFMETVDEATKKKVAETYQLPSEFVLYVGTVEDRKNLLNLVKAMHVANLNTSLVAIGRHKTYAKQVKNYIHKHNLTFVHFLENVDFRDFPAIYQSAICMANLSYFEGFGIPIVESMYSGLPMVLSNSSCFPEIAGNTAIFVNPDNIAEIGRALNTVLSDTNVRASLLNHADERKYLFSHVQMAERINNCYKPII
ncbi:MAG: glycosyltransferase family 4 protein [Bacteroidales bacterium]|jgi:glycosyltransferase involved in cell wall biosynthesis|nr:glycosyltransferase family 4 protein [Bacteroidales bacterium]